MEEAMASLSYVVEGIHLLVPPNDVAVVFVPDRNLEPGEVRVQPLPLLGRLFRGARMSCELKDTWLVVRITLWCKSLPPANPRESRMYYANTAASPTRYPVLLAGEAISKLVVAFGDGQYGYRIN